MDSEGRLYSIPNHRTLKDMEKKVNRSLVQIDKEDLETLIYLTPDERLEFIKNKHTNVSNLTFEDYKNLVQAELKRLLRKKRNIKLEDKENSNSAIV